MGRLGVKSSCHGRRIWQLKADKMKRFFAKIASPNSNGCMLWTAATRRDGYGLFGLDFGETPVSAHRMSWMIANKRSVPPGMCVCHRCDVRLCVNPEHLFVGSLSDNNADCRRKGRNARGETVCTAKLTEGQVMEIRRLYRSGLRNVDLCRRYRISATNVSNIVRHKRWAHVEEAL